MVKYQTRYLLFSPKASVLRENGIQKKPQTKQLLCILKNRRECLKLSRIKYLVVFHSKKGTVTGKQ